jgi:hypothetical protein
MVRRSQTALGATLAKLRARIDDLRERGEHVSEQDTKAILIDPVLAALGWRLDELGDVRREYRAKPQDNPVDYALLVFGQPRLFVEAKALSTTLDRKCASQVLGYASVVGVGWCLLTNGDEYRLYNSHAKVDVDEKLLRTVRLSDPAQAELCIETLELMAREEMGDTELDLLWKSQFVDRRVKATLEDLFEDESGALARLVRKHSSELTLGDVRESLRRAQVQVHFPMMTPPAATTQRSGASSPIVDQPTTGAASKTGKTPVSYAVGLQDLIDADLVRPPVSLERKYKGVRLEATIEADGRVCFAGERFDSLSTAAGMARKSVIGAPPGRLYPQTNGWTFWSCRDGDSGELHSVDDLRQRYLQQAADVPGD